MAVVNNIGTNYTLYYNVVDFFGTIMTNHPSIAKVTTGDLYGVDVTEFPQYPIGNINVLGARFGEKTTTLTIQLVIADKVKDKNNESIGRENYQKVPFYGTDDTIDILSNALSILNDLLTYTDYGVTAFEFSGEPNATPFKDDFDNGLAGWVCTFDLVAFNQADRCLFNLDGSGNVDLC
jgi:hypothetical protein